MLFIIFSCLPLFLQIGADIFKRALSYPSKLIAENAGINGDVVVEKVYKWFYSFKLLHCLDISSKVAHWVTVEYKVQVNVFFWYFISGVVL